MYARATVSSLTLSKTSPASESLLKKRENVSNVRQRKLMGACPLRVYGKRVTSAIRGYGTYKTPQQSGDIRVRSQQHEVVV